MKHNLYKHHTFSKISVLTIVLASLVGGMAHADSNKSKTTVGNDWEKDGGIRVLSIRQTAAGYMLDFRYKVLNPKKAAIFLNRDNKPLLTVLKNGLRLQVPVTAKIGPLRQSARLAIKGKNYFMFFGNPSRMVVSGDKVQVQIGDFKSDELIVE